MFYFQVFYLPCLKTLINKKYEKYNEVHFWGAQFIFPPIYVPLLLRLSNDVEENPGPFDISEIVDPTYTVHADFHQDNESMFASNAGKQCVAMSLYAIVYNEINNLDPRAFS